MIVLSIQSKCAYGRHGFMVVAYELIERPKSKVWKRCQLENYWSWMRRGYESAKYEAQVVARERNLPIIEGIKSGDRFTEEHLVAALTSKLTGTA